MIYICFMKNFHKFIHIVKIKNIYILFFLHFQFIIFFYIIFKEVLKLKIKRKIKINK